MDPIDNPFSPGAGAPPPELVGRDDILNQTTTGIARTKACRSERSRLLTGLRGVGKTVLLNKIAWIARQQECITLQMEARECQSLAEMIAPAVEEALNSLDKIRGTKDALAKGWKTFKALLGGARIRVSEFEVGFDPTEGNESRGASVVESTLPPLIEAAAEAAKERNTSIVILVDEMQYLDIPSLRALIFSLHNTQQKQLPFYLVGAGLPNLPGLAAEAVSYAERLFLYPVVGPLSQSDTEKALQDPVQKYNVHFEQEALDEIFRQTQGYPYFVQEWGSQSWNLSMGPTITKSDVRKATLYATSQLDERFFRARIDRLTPSEKTYLRAMSHIGPGQLRTGDISKVLGRRSGDLGPTRDKLIKKGMIYSPSHGLLAFTVPLFDEYMKRVMPEFAGSTPGHAP